ncbi:MAG: hypothetical protein KBC05_19510, partial [Candidatus Hydrogenedentes bacterium]|nr:hypothetical protein [Candidatus Hydrogenedentota bacterium]
MKARRLVRRFVTLGAVSMTFLATQAMAGTALTGITVFSCDEHGTVNPALRFNSGPVDAAWDLFVARTGDDPDAPPQWLNQEDNRIHVPLGAGTHAFALYFDSPGLERFMGINLFFDGVDAAPAISGYVDTQAAESPALKANTSGKTHGLPITEIPAAGTLEFRSAKAGIWTADLS